MAAPALNIPPAQYDRAYFMSLINTLRLYFTGQVDIRDPYVVAATGLQTVTLPTVLLGPNNAGVTLVDTTSNSVALVLPDAIDGYQLPFTIKRITAGGNTVTVTAASGNIDGAGSLSIPTQYQAYSFCSDGTNYWLV